MDDAVALCRMELERRYGYWALAQWKRELTAGFPTLTALAPFSTSATIALDTFSQMEPERRDRLATALVLRAHTESFELTGNGGALSDEQQGLVQEWLAVVSANLSGARKSRPDRKKLRRDLAAAMSRVAQEVVRLGRTERLVFEVRTGDQVVETHCDLGGRTHFLRYHHVVRWRDTPIKSGASPLTWLGIASTVIDVVEPGREGDVASAVASLAAYFRAECDQLLGGC